MEGGVVNRDDLDRAKDEAVRLATAEAVRVAGEESDRKIVAAVNAVMTNVTLHVGMAEKTLVARIDGLKWKLVAALVGGQTVAGVGAAYVTGHGEKVQAVASAILTSFV